MWRCLSLLLLGCTTVVYEPTICVEERVDTVGVVTVNGVVTNVVTYTTCARWRAWSDSTKCWTNDGLRTAC